MSEECLTRESLAWPKSVERLSRPPSALFLRGQMPELSQAVAIVGTRRASPQAIGFTQQLAFDLVKSGCVIVSGGAYGIDAASHEGALQGLGQTIAVLPSPLSRPYPPRHRALFERIVQSGALLSESNAKDFTLWRSSFLQRNRLIAALARLVIVVEAPLKSGALSTAGWARSLGLPICVVPLSPWNHRGFGNHELLKQGAKICTTAQDVLTIVDSPTIKRSGARGSKTKTMTKNAYSDDQQLVLSALKRGAVQSDTLLRRTAMDAAKLQQVLTQLMLMHLIKEPTKGSFVLNPNCESFV